MKKYLIAAAVMVGIAAPAFADDVGVHAGPGGAGVAVCETHDRDRPVVKSTNDPTARPSLRRKTRTAIERKP